MLRDSLSLSVLQAQLRGPREFRMPWIHGLPAFEPSPLHAALAHIGTLALMTAALALVAQRARRIAASVLVLGYGYAFLNDAPGYTNNGVLLLILLGVVLAEPLGPTARVWPVRIGQITLLAVYLGGACAKLDEYWLSGALLREILQRYSGQYAHFFGWDAQAVFAIGATLALATELAVGVGLWFARTRMAATALGTSFHLAIEALLPVRMFAPLVIGAYALFLSDARAEAVLARTTAIGRSITGQVGMFVVLWLSNSLGYPTRPMVAIDVSVVIVLLRTLELVRAKLGATAVPSASPSPPERPSARWPTIAVACCAVAQSVLLAKPAWGMSKHFAWRMFSESLVMRVVPEVALAGHWRKARFPDSQARWRDDGFRYHWSSWSEERIYVQGYTDWLATTFPAAKPLRVVVTYRLNGAAPKTTIFRPR